jgi:tetratricopeptide (TPR) repeat protein/tRNA A-37 threonylcarbamoyl transferase component Bud32
MPMSRADPDRTVDLSRVRPVDLVCARYDESWKRALVSGGPPPERESFLTEAGEDHDDWATELTLIDGAYSRVLQLLNTGVVNLSRTPEPAAGRASQLAETIAPSEVVNGPAAAEAGGVVSHYAETLDVPGTPPERSRGADPDHAETVDSAPAGDSPAADSPHAPEGSRVGNYELLGVIAHGGMGVVYKARHTRLDRYAAIKMVLAGAHATPQQLARFQAEAQAVARLQHPNIVQLYEVGEQDDLPYIALEYVDGGSLAQKVGAMPQPPRAAAEQVERLARAMHFAHEHGVVHRDLKPANILLTSDGVPKVTDFGLAKRLEADSGQTRTGTLMGTPSFMAPEQARGDNKSVGPCSDIYALGAILYDLLTGRPPFAAGSAMETVVAVLKTEPVAPTRLQAGVPRDLETICLKCLQKEPHQRYATAAELADDLRRFLSGEPIRARPVGVAERLWRWARRNPGIATLIAAVLLLLTTVAAGSTAAAVRIRAEQRLAEENSAAARRAQGDAEDALREVERQKQIAETSAAQARAAQGQAEKARTVADELATVASEQRELALDAVGALVTKVLDRLDNSEGSQLVKKELLDLAIDRLKKITGSAEQTAVADMRMAEAHRRLGDLARRLGDTPLARRNYEQVDRISRQHLAENPNDRDWRRTLSVADVLFGDLALEAGDRGAARKHYGAARTARADLAEADGASRPARVDLAQAAVKLGDVSEPDRAVDYYREALGIRESILDGNPDDPNARRDVGLAYYKLADGYRRNRAPADGRKHAEEAVRRAQALADDYPTLPALQQDLALAHMKLGDLLDALKETGAAATNYEKAIRKLEPLAARNQKDHVLQLTFSLLLARVGKHAEATARAGRVCDAAPKNPFLLYNAACVYALAAEKTVARPGDTPTPAEKKLIAGYREAALKRLRAAVAAGFADLEQVRSSAELDGVRTLPEFAEVVKSLR